MAIDAYYMKWAGACYQHGTGPDHNHPSKKGPVMADAQSTVEYRDVLGFPGYRVGSNGQFISCRVRRSGGGRRGSLSVLSSEWHPIKGHILQRFGYIIMTLMKNNKMNRLLAHRLVLEAFVGPCPEGMEACHNDGNRTNNVVTNLRWDTRKNNHADKKRHGTHQQGSRANSAKLDEEKVKYVLRQLLAGRTGLSLALELGVRPSAISCIKLRKTWLHVSLND